MRFELHKKGILKRLETQHTYSTWNRNLYIGRYDRHVGSTEIGTTL
jgi:hypothetical protein